MPDPSTPRPAQIRGRFARTVTCPRIPVTDRVPWHMNLTGA